MSDFYPYPHYSKMKNKGVSTSVVLRSEKKQFRLSGEELKRFNEHKFYSKLDESKFIKQLITEALDKREADSWMEEVKDL